MRFYCPSTRRVWYLLRSCARVAVNGGQRDSQRGGSMQIAITVLIATLEYARGTPCCACLFARLVADMSRRSRSRGEFRVRPRKTTALLNNLNSCTWDPRRSSSLLLSSFFLCLFAASCKRLKIYEERLANRLNKLWRRARRSFRI